MFFNVTWKLIFAGLVSGLNDIHEIHPIAHLQ
jgi:hypothetical protein